MIIPRRSAALPASLVIFVILVILGSFVPAAGADPVPGGLCDSSSNRPIARVRPGPYAVGSTEVVELESDYDGEVIHMGVVRPAVPKTMRVPVIVFASPYLNHDLEDGDLERCQPRLVENFVQHGYAVGFVAVRGTSDSGGCSDLMGNAERADLDQAVTWFGTRSWSNGNVGMIGVSYDGSTPWEVAAAGNKHLKTIVPISGVNDIYHLMFRNGAPEFRAPLLLNALYYVYPYTFGNPISRSPERFANTIICPEAMKGLYASMHSTATGERDPLGYWAERNSRPGVEKRYKGSIFLVHGLQDWNVDPGHDFPWVTKLDRKGIYVKYLLGQWGHAWPDTSASPRTGPHDPVRWDWADILLDWWDYWLKGKRDVDLGPRAQVQDSAGRWRNEASWPPKDARRTRLFLTPSGGLSDKPSDEQGSELVGLDVMRLAAPSAPVNAPCPACPAFEFGPVDRELRFAGIPELDLSVTPLGPSGHISAWLYGVSENGTSKRLGWGMVDLRFAKNGETAQRVVPGEELDVHIPIEPLDAVLEKGERLVVVISQGGYGSAIVADHLPSSPPAPVELHVGGDASTLTLGFFTRGPKSFFVPPLEARPPR